MIAEASPTIEKVLAMQACFSPSNSYGVYRSNGGGLFDGPATGGVHGGDYTFTHHDVTRCLNVQRIKDWKASAKNALTFRVVYVSEESGESAEFKYEMQKQLDDVWLFNN